MNGALEFIKKNGIGKGNTEFVLGVMKAFEITSIDGDLYTEISSIIKTVEENGFLEKGCIKIWKHELEASMVNLIK